jgi:hypothetical protein
MAGNVFEWTATFMVRGDGVEGPVCKSYSAMYERVPWFDNMIALRTPGGFGPGDHYEYTGFRPVRDHWQIRHWNGWSQVSIDREPGRGQ